MTISTSIHNPQNWRSINRQTCFNCKFRVWKRESETGETYCSLYPRVPLGDGNARPSRFTCNDWRKWE